MKDNGYPGTQRVDFVRTFYFTDQRKELGLSACLDISLYIYLYMFWFILPLMHKNKLLLNFLLLAQGHGCVWNPFDMKGLTNITLKQKIMRS